MGWLLEQWKEVRRLFYEERAAVTVARFYLQWYEVDVKKNLEVETEFEKLKDKLYKAVVAYTLWFVSDQLSDYFYCQEITITEEDIKKLKLCGMKVNDVLKGRKELALSTELGNIDPFFLLPYLFKQNQRLNKCAFKIVEDIYLRSCSIPREVIGDMIAKAAIYLEKRTGEVRLLEETEASVKYFDSVFPTFRSLLSFCNKYEFWMYEDIPVRRLLEMIQHVHLYRKITVIDSFFYVAHQQGQILVDRVVTTRKAIRNLERVLDAVRKGNLRFLRSFLRRSHNLNF